MRLFYCFSIKRGKVTNNCQLHLAMWIIFIQTAHFFMSSCGVYRRISFSARWWKSSRARVSGILNGICMHPALSVCNVLNTSTLWSVHNAEFNLHSYVHLPTLLCTNTGALHAAILLCRPRKLCRLPLAFCAMGERYFCCSDRLFVLPLFVCRPAMSVRCVLCASNV